jgi:hypothetical protein
MDARSSISLRPRRVIRQIDGRRVEICVFVDRASPKSYDSWQGYVRTAVQLGYFEVAKLLFAAGYGITVDDVTLSGDTALHLMAKSMDVYRFEEARVVETIECLLTAYGADDGRAINLVNDVGETPLFYAARGGMPAVCRLLIDRGANPNIGRLGAVPLIASCFLGDIKMVELMLSEGADPNGLPLLVDQPKDDGEYWELYSTVEHSPGSSLPIGVCKAILHFRMRPCFTP